MVGCVISLVLEPELVIGDLDLLEAGEIEEFKKNSQVRVEQYPVHKDETDLESAVETVVKQGYTTILILAALGGRLDMTLANIFLLTLPGIGWAGCSPGRWARRRGSICPGARDGRLIDGAVGDQVSLSLGGPAQGIQGQAGCSVLSPAW